MKSNKYLRTVLNKTKNSAMKKRIVKLLALSGFFALFTLGAKAQCTLNPDGSLTTADGQPCANTVVSAVPFLRIVPDARSGAMGDVGLAIAPDANAMYFNASNLVFADKPLSIAATYTPWLRALGLNDVYLANLSGYRKLDEIQAIGASVTYFSLGDIQFTDNDGNPTGMNRPNELALNVAYARKLTDQFAAAVSLKYIYSNLANGQSIGTIDIKAGQSVAADISFSYQKDFQMSDKESRLKLGTAITNLGPKITYTNSQFKDFLPTNFGLGAGLELNFDEFNSFTIAADINKMLVPTPIPANIKNADGTISPNPDYDPNRNGVPDYKEKSFTSAIFSSWGDAPGGFSEEMRELTYSIGMEYWYDKQFAVRAGYYYENAQKGNRRYFTVGMGLKYNIFGINFSYLVPTSNQRNPLDNTLRFSLLFDVGGYGEEEDL